MVYESGIKSETDGQDEEKVTKKQICKISSRLNLGWFSIVANAEYIMHLYHI